MSSADFIQGLLIRLIFYGTINEFLIPSINSAVDYLNSMNHNFSVFRNDEKKLLVFQIRSGINAQGKDDFVAALVDW